jgi:hypothetical protein
MKNILSILFMLTSLTLKAQIGLNIELQAYPTGLIPSIGLSHELGAKAELQFRLGANLIDHKDFGVQDSEKGIGFGGSVTYRIFKNEDRKKIYLGLRSDLWRNTIDWYNGVEPVIASGTSKLIMFQPTTELGYRFYSSKNKWFIQPALAFGREFNLRTEGAEIGQGWILLAGLSVGI